MSDPIRGITCPDMRRVVREAIAGGWEFAGMTGTTHLRIRWPESGDVIQVGTTPSLASWKTIATEVQRKSGVIVWRRGNRKRSRKSFAPTADPQVEASRRRYAAEVEAAQTKREQQEHARLRRLAEIRAIEAADRRRREIEGLMRR